MLALVGYRFGLEGKIGKNREKNIEVVFKDFDLRKDRSMIIWE
jgi:hypothetical protein